MIYRTVFLLLLSMPLWTKETSLDQQVSSTHASYDGNSLLLEGKVQLQHGLGNMHAEQARLQKQEIGKDFPFSLIHLQENVVVSLKNTSELLCDFAELDFVALKGILSSLEGKKVSYKDFIQKGTVPLRLTGKHLDLLLSKEGATNEYKISSVLVKQEVQIEYSNDFLLKSDEASYQNTDPQNSHLHGILQAYPTSSTSKCQLFYQGEQLDAQSIYIDVDHNQLTIDQPNGSLPSHLFAEKQTSPLFFTCKKLLWDHDKENLLLQEQVTLEEKTLGTLYAEKELFLQLGSSSEKKFIQSIQIDGFSHIKHEDSSSGWQHKFTCFGNLHVDGENNQILFTSPQQEEKRLCYEDPELIIRARKGRIEYSEASYKPISLTLQGDVTIQSTETSGPRRIGLADTLTYSPETQTIILSALPKKRVLFLDEGQNLTMSALEIHLVQDASTGQMQAKGIGNVQFSFSSEENNLLKKWILPLAEELTHVIPE